MISIILGTRPEIIKMAPVIRACRKKGSEFSVLHTGQHYSYEMDRIFFEELELPAPDHNLDVGSGSHAEQTGKIMAGVEQILKADPPDIVLVQGDTNTVLAGTDPENIVQAAGTMMDASPTWENPFGDGKSAERIVRICTQVVRDNCR
jgi:UDP-N-acetylglucosamine 2-epimerase